MKKYWWMVVFFILGILFRLWFSQLVPQPFVGDQYDYNRFAQGIKETGLFALTSRLYGYPLVLAALYTLFGPNWQAVYLFQAILDTTTAFLIFLIGKKIFGQNFPSLLAFFLYLFNPFSSSFVGMILTEVTAIFFLTLALFLFLLFLEQKKITFLIPFAFLLGYLPQIRPPFLFFTFGFLPLLFFLIKKIFRERRKAVFSFFSCCLLYFLPFSYNIAGNLVYFGEVNPLTVDNIFVRELYISLYVERSPFHAVSLSMFPAEVRQIYSELTPLPKNREERKMVATKYFNLAIEEIKKNPSKFLISHLKKMWYVWEKHFIFYYYEPENRIRSAVIYWGNVFFLITALWGLVSWLREVRSQNDKRQEWWFGLLTAFLFIHISLLHSFSLSEERYSLPAYPLVFLFSSYSIWHLIKAGRRMIQKRA